MKKESKIIFFKEGELSRALMNGRTPHIYPFVERVENVDVNGLNSLLSRERDWYILKVYTLRERLCEPITMFIIGYAPEFTKEINKLRENDH